MDKKVLFTTRNEEGKLVEVFSGDTIVDTGDTILIGEFRLPKDNVVLIGANEIETIGDLRTVYERFAQEQERNIPGVEDWIKERIPTSLYPDATTSAGVKEEEPRIR